MKKFVFGIILLLSISSQHIISSEKKQLAEENKIEELYKQLEEELTKQLGVEFRKLSPEDQLEYSNYIQRWEICNQKQAEIAKDEAYSDEIGGKEINRLNWECAQSTNSAWLFGPKLKDLSSVCRQLDSIRRLRIYKRVNEKSDVNPPKDFYTQQLREKYSDIFKIEEKDSN
ncbi:MAG: hypothetical protein P4L22_00295 [Candidatus Babeliales bacterium]|nr:hypothetical protein [Candidatus Babeliales bacterium]